MVSVIGSVHQNHHNSFPEVDNQFDVPTLMTPTPSHLTSFCLMCGAKQVSELINRPIVVLFGVRGCGTSGEVFTGGQSETFFNHSPRVVSPTSLGYGRP
jgi:hypothetical protein